MGLDISTTPVVAGGNVSATFKDGLGLTLNTVTGVTDASGKVSLNSGDAFDFLGVTYVVTISKSIYYGKAQGTLDLLGNGSSDVIMNINPTGGIVNAIGNAAGSTVGFIEVLAVAGVALWGISKIVSSMDPLQLKSITNGIGGRLKSTFNSTKRAIASGDNY